MKVDRVVLDAMSSIRNILRALDSGVTPEDNMGPTRAPAGSVLTSTDPNRKPSWQALGPLTPSTQPGVPGTVDLSNYYTKGQVNQLVIDTRVFGVSLDSSPNSLAPGFKSYITIPFGGTITGWAIDSVQTGSAVFDVWMTPRASAPPTVANTIFGAKPTLSSAMFGEGGIPSVSFSPNTVFGFNLDSCLGVSRMSLIITVAV